MSRNIEITDSPPDEVLGVLRGLSQALDVSIPPKVLDRNLLVATWNVRAFGNVTKRWKSRSGDSPKRDYQDIHCIKEIVSRFDVIALQEVKGNLRGLRYLLKLLGPDWAFLLTDVTGGAAGNDERMAFVFDTRRLKSSGLACELVVSAESDPAIGAGALSRQFARTPYAVSFVSAGRTFILVTLHVIYGDKPADRLAELEAIARWLANWATQVDDYNQNLMALGDFNIDRQDDPSYQAFVSTGLTPPPELQGIPRTIFSGPGVGYDQFYDQIAWFPSEFSLNYTSKAGNFDFTAPLRGTKTNLDLSWKLSDHYPLWAEFSLTD
jgi:endonuclease/exonuclease/phosphatase family metal-dependent hydrolase